MSIDDRVPFEHPWPEERLDKLADVIVGGTPSTSVRAFWGGDIPWMSSGDVHLRRINSVPGRITQKGLSSSNATLVDPPAVVIALAGQGKTRGTVGLTFTRLCGNQSIAFIKPRSDELNASFLFHCLEIRYEELRARSAGGGRAGLSKGILEHLPICFPDPVEQREIAAFLDTADESIAKTEALIAKLKAIKQGLLHELLTRGLDDNGLLRDPDSHPEHFKESPLGYVPIAWDTPTINDLAIHVGSGITPTGGSNVYKSEGVLFIRSQNVTFEGLLLEDVAYIDYRTHQMMARSEVSAHDVLLNITGASIGRCCPVPEGLGSANVNQHVCAIRTAKPRREDAVFLSAVLASFIGQRQIDRLNAGSNRQGLNYQQLRSFVLPWPRDDSERVEIATKIESAESRIIAEKSYLSKLEAIKKGLMQDLLTGRVRVPFKDGD